MWMELCADFSAPIAVDVVVNGGCGDVGDGDSRELLAHRIEPISSMCGSSFVLSIALFLCHVTLKPWFTRALGIGGPFFGIYELNFIDSTDTRAHSTRSFSERSDENTVEIYNAVLQYADGSFSIIE